MRRGWMGSQHKMEQARQGESKHKKDSKLPTVQEKKRNRDVTYSLHSIDSREPIATEIEDTVWFEWT